MTLDDDDDGDVMMTVRFSEAEIAMIDEIVEELRALYDPDMDRDRLLGRIHVKASRAVLDGEIEPAELHEILNEMIAGDLIHRHRDELPENPTRADVERFADEIKAELTNVEKTRNLIARAMFVIALNHWREFGLGPFRERWFE